PVRVMFVMSASQRLGFDGPSVLHPAEMVNDVDIVVAVNAPARPNKTVEPLHLIIQFANIGGLAAQPPAALHSIAPHQENVAKFAILDALLQFQELSGMAGHERSEE